MSVAPKSKKKAEKFIKLQVAAGKANPAPPIGPALGQHGLNIMDFCKRFNDATKSFELGLVIPVIISVYKDKTFDFTLKQPPVSVLIKKALGLESASKEPGKTIVAKLPMSKVRDIAKQKASETNSMDIEAVSKMIMGTARSMGIEVIE